MSASPMVVEQNQINANLDVLWNYYRDTESIISPEAKEPVRHALVSIGEMFSEDGRVPQVGQGVKA